MLTSWSTLFKPEPGGSKSWQRKARPEPTLRLPVQDRQLNVVATFGRATSWCALIAGLSEGRHPSSSCVQGTPLTIAFGVISVAPCSRRWWRRLSSTATLNSSRRQNRKSSGAQLTEPRPSSLAARRGSPLTCTAHFSERGLNPLSAFFADIPVEGRLADTELFRDLVDPLALLN